jgi:TonB family protein
MPVVPGAAVPAAAPTAVRPASAEAGKPGAKGERGDKATALDASRMFLNKDASPDVMEFYPAESRAGREAGKVGLRVCAGPDGAVVGEPKVLKTSGHDRLDIAARRWAQAAKWVPATVNQRSVEGCAEVTAAFRP